MANVKISEMPAATSISADDIIPIVQSGNNKKLSYSVLKAQQQKGYNCYNWYNSTDQTLDTNYTKLNGFDLNITTKGGDVLVTIVCPAQITAAGTGSFYVYLDEARKDRIQTINGTNLMIYSGQLLLKNVSAGTHAISIYGRSDNAAYNLMLPKNIGKSFSIIEL